MSHAARSAMRSRVAQPYAAALPCSRQRGAPPLAVASWSPQATRVCHIFFFFFFPDSSSRSSSSSRCEICTLVRAREVAGLLGARHEGTEAPHRILLFSGLTNTTHAAAGLKPGAARGRGVPRAVQSSLLVLLCVHKWRPALAQSDIADRCPAAAPAAGRRRAPRPAQHCRRCRPCRPPPQRLSPPQPSVGQRCKPQAHPPTCGRRREWAPRRQVPATCSGQRRPSCRGRRRGGHQVRQVLQRPTCRARGTAAGRQPAAVEIPGGTVLARLARWTAGSG